MRALVKFTAHAPRLTAVFEAASKLFSPMVGPKHYAGERNAGKVMTVDIRITGIGEIRCQAYEE